MNKITHAMVVVLSTMILSLQVNDVLAVDTKEPFERGYSNLDFYLGYDGIGQPFDERTVYGETMIGAGVTDFLSMFIGTVLYGNGQFSEGNAAFYLGGYLTPVDTNHVDLDLELAFAVDQGAFTMSPGFQLNLDFKPDLSFMGFWIDGGSAVYGSGLGVPSVAGGELNPQTDTFYDLSFLVGYYWTVAENHQLLLAYDFAIEQLNGGRSFNSGGIGIGYNVTLADHVEMINQVFVDLPQDGEQTSVGLMTGFIATFN